MTAATEARLQSLVEAAQVMEVRLAEFEQVQFELLQSVHALQSQLGALVRRQKLSESQIEVTRTRLNKLSPKASPRAPLPQSAPAQTESPPSPSQPAALLQQERGRSPFHPAVHLRAGLTWVRDRRPWPALRRPFAALAGLGCIGIAGLVIHNSNLPVLSLASVTSRAVRLPAWRMPWAPPDANAAVPAPSRTTQRSSNSPAPSSPSAMIRLTAVDSTWLEVEDAQGKVLHYGNMQPGQLTFPLTASLRIRAGRPDLIQVQHGGQTGPLGGVDDTDWRVYR